MRHSSGNLFAEFDRPVNMHRGIQVAGLVRDEARHDPNRGFAGGFYILATTCGLPVFAASLKPGKWGGAYAGWMEAYSRVVGLGVLGEDLAVATNRVSLHGSEKDRYGLPIPCLHIDDHPNETPMQHQFLEVPLTSDRSGRAQRMSCVAGSGRAHFDSAEARRGKCLMRSPVLEIPEENGNRRSARRWRRFGLGRHVRRRR